jgi:hypothetical protein
MFVERLKGTNSYKNNIGNQFHVFTHSMASLLSKFRIDYQSLKMVSGISEAPQADTLKYFNKLLEGFSEDDGVDPGTRNRD